MPTTSYTFTTTANYTFNATDIVVTGVLAQLVLDGTYPTTNPKIEPIISISQDAITSFLATIVAAGSDAVQFTLKLDGQEKYWDSAAWVNSDGTYAQSNTLADIQANIATFTTRGTIIPVIFLHSDDGSTTPSIDVLTIDFNHYGGAASTENVCNVWGYVYDQLNNPIDGASIIVTPVDYGLTGDKVINLDPTTVTTDSTGYWEISLIETDTDGNNWFYGFNVAGKLSSKLVPNQVSANFNDLIKA